MAADRGLNIEALRHGARQASAAGNRAGAMEAWSQLLIERPDDAEAANALGNLALSAGDVQAARSFLERAVNADPGQPALLFNLAAACSGCDDPLAALSALDRALAADPYFVQALYQKGVVLAGIGQAREAAQVFRDLLDTVPDAIRDDPRFAAMMTRATDAVAADGRTLATAIKARVAPPSRRTSAAIANITGDGPLYRSEPTFLTVPELPSIPFLERDDIPWLDQLEADWVALRDEAAGLIVDAERFAPYVANPPGTPLNQWDKLDHNRDWGALFFWHHGRRDGEAAAQLPRTAAMLDRMPLLRLDGRGPNAFLSRLAPRTKIPAHHGVTNARLTVHLPLIVPQGCGFRVGGETREWLPGRAWVFDDTIEHEAWNDSDEPRVILIFDIWHPLLDAAERDYLATALRTYDEHYGRARNAGDEF
ncbi:aspartyl/asparaginyl beta-hydroxylase domain-containing protein [Novosphingobium sp. Gsoil 351]|uniref:aspartyl/asparaginyl beta-hydroxylase domain-containing protein n=1 Tax=Novosphingobium sp. Gsoil 351 TaxID=2675225 RepID=UPI0012B4798F|nr:aspartyl/asparaginyl beta-hydroxylase domain-containing protein [Novosphingobium sp. Gsoil 351]QGN55110.1 hypothetical protein GKE62_11650 [Novosphingobium sp. Gsoil 351]